MTLTHYQSVEHDTLAHFVDELAAFSTLRALADSVSFSLQALLISSPSGVREGAPVFLSVCPLSPPPTLCRFSPFALSALPSVFLAVSFCCVPPRSLQHSMVFSLKPFGSRPWLPCHKIAKMNECCGRSHKGLSCSAVSVCCAAAPPCGTKGRTKRAGYII